MKLTLIAAALLLVGGCTVTTTHDYTLDSAHFSVTPGACALISGPHSVPDGTIMDYTLVDDAPGTDLMDVTIVDDIFPSCDFSSIDGYPATDVFFASDAFSSTTGSAPSGFYDFWVRCNNSIDYCQFTLDWTANY
jgi:hypothetical protein